MTPKSIGLAAAPHSPEAKERLAGEAPEPVGSSPEEFGRFIRAEIARRYRVVKASGAKPDWTRAPLRPIRVKA